MSNNKDIYEMAVAMSKKELELTERLFKEKCEIAMSPKANIGDIIICQQMCGTLERIRKEYKTNITYP